MAQRDFFYNIPLVDFKPGTPDVDLNFLKSLADDYKATVDKADAAKEDIINKLGSLNLHQTFSNDYAEYMKNVEKQIGDLDTRYQGKMIDRNYKNELSMLVRNIQNDPNLRYMANTSKELFTYEQMKRESQDYLEYNDPMIQGYQAILNRAKGDKPTFTATNIYKDMNPMEQLRNIAKEIAITESTEFHYDKALGTVETWNKKTRTKEDITGKMAPTMAAFKATQAGQQIEREAQWRKKADGSSYTYEELFIEKVNGISDALTLESTVKSLAVDPATTVDLQRQEVMLNALKLLQDKDQFDQQFSQMVKQAKNEDVFKLQQLQLEYAKLGYDVMKFNAQIMYQYQTKGLEAAIDYMGKNLKDVQDGTYIPGVGGVGGGGTSSKTPNAIDVSRFTGSGVAAVTADLPTYSQLDNLQNEKGQVDQNLIALKTQLNQSIGTEDMQKVDAYLSALQNGNGSAFDSDININIAGTVYTKKISEAILLDNNLNNYQNNWLQAVAMGNTYDAVVYDATKNFYSAVSNNQQVVNDLFAAGVLVSQGDQNSPYTTGNYRNNYAGVNESALLKYYGVDIENIKSHYNVNIGYTHVVRFHPGGGDYLAKEPQVLPYNEVLSIANSNTGGTYVDRNGKQQTLTSAAAKIALNAADQNIIATAYGSNAVLSKWKEFKDQAIANVYGTKGATVSGYKLIPNGTGNLSELDKQYTAGLNNSLAGLRVYDVNTGIRYMWSQGKGLQKTTSTGEGTGEYYNYISPSIAYLDRTGRVVIQANAYQFDPNNLKQGQVNPSTAVTLVDDPGNIKATFLDPLFNNSYGPRIGPAISVLFQDKAKWVMNTVSNLPKNVKTDIHYKPGILITRNVDNTYTVSSSSGGALQANNEFQLAEILARVDYQSTKSASTSVPEIGEIPQLPLSGFKAIDELIDDYNQITEGIPKDITTQTTTGNASSTTTNRDGNLIRDLIMEKIFHTAVKQKESGGNYGAVNKFPSQYPDGTPIAPTYASGAFQFVPSIWNNQIKKWAKEYGKPNADTYDIYDPKAQEKAGPARQDFLSDAAFQNYCMQKATEMYISSYEKDVPAAAKNVMSLSEYTVMAHSIGQPAATAYAKLQAGLITEEDLDDRVKKLIPIGEEYLKDVNTRLSKDIAKASKPAIQVDPAAVSTDIALKDLAPGTTVELGDGSTYTATEPAGTPNPTIPNWEDLPNETVLSNAHKSQMITKAIKLFEEQAEKISTVFSDTDEKEQIIQRQIDNFTKYIYANKVNKDQAMDAIMYDFALDQETDRMIYFNRLFNENVDKLQEFSSQIYIDETFNANTEFSRLKNKTTTLNGLSETEEYAVKLILYELDNYITGGVDWQWRNYADRGYNDSYIFAGHDALNLGLSTLIDNLGGSLDRVIANMKRSNSDDYALSVINAVKAASTDKILGGFRELPQRIYPGK